MLRTPLSRAVIGAVLGAFGAVLTGYVLDPVWHLSGDRLYVFIGESCSKSMDLLTQLESDSALSARVVPLLAEDASEDTRARVCALISEDIESHAPWFSLGGSRRGWICGRIEAWSRYAHRREFVGLPSWSEGRTPVDRRREAGVLAAHGLRRRGDAPLELVGEADEGLVVELSPHADNVPVAVQPREAPYALDEWRGYDIGF